MINWIHLQRLQCALRSAIIPPVYLSQGKERGKSIKFLKVFVKFLARNTVGCWRKNVLTPGKKWKSVSEQNYFWRPHEKTWEQVDFNSEVYPTNASTSLMSQDGRRNKAKCVCVSYQWES